MVSVFVVSGALWDAAFRIKSRLVGLELGYSVRMEQQVLLCIVVSVSYIM